MAQAKQNRRDLKLRDALRIKPAEFWLRLGERGQALLELRKIPRRVWDQLGRKPA